MHQSGLQLSHRLRDHAALSRSSPRCCNLFLALPRGKRLKSCTARIVPNHSAFRKRNRFGTPRRRPPQRSETLSRCPEARTCSKIVPRLMNALCYGAFDSLAPAHSACGLPVYVTRLPPAPFCETVRGLRAHLRLIGSAVLSSPDSALTNSAHAEVTLLTIVSATALGDQVSTATPKPAFHDCCLVVIPALNEEATIATVVQNLRQHAFRRIRVIDNGSTDATASRAGAAGADVFMEPRCGYGRACRRGLTKLPRGVAWILFCDADGSDDLDDLDAMIAAAEDADLVLSNRFATRAGRQAMTLMQRMGNRLVSRLVEYGWGSLC
jgi:Glycosyl transferase family 2